MTVDAVGGVAGFKLVNGEGAASEAAAADLIHILNAVDVPIIVITRAYTIACFNQAAENLFGLAASNIGEAPTTLPVLAGLTTLRERCAEVVAVGGAARLDFQAADKWFVARVAPYSGADGQVSGTVLTFTNVTAFRASIDQAIYEREYTKAILNTIAEPIVVLDADHRVLSGNRAFYELFSASRDTAVGKSLSQLFGGASEALRLGARLRDNLADTAALKLMEFEHDFPTWGKRSFILDARPLSLPGHAQHKTLLAFQDITERKQAEAANARLAAIVECSDDAIVGEDLDGVIISWNLGAEQIFGYAAHEVVGKPMTLLIPPDLHDEEWAILSRIRRGERTNQFDTVRRRKDGGQINVSVTVSPVKDADGQIVAASKIARDITEHKRLERDLSDFFENASVALHWVGPDGTILRANRRELQMLGYSSEEYVGRHISLFHVDQNAISDILRGLSNGEIISNYPAQLRCRDGTIRDVVIDSSVLWDNGRFVHTRCFTIDVTARKKAEQAQRMLMGELQHRVKNTLATVQAMASQTLHSASPTEQQTFTARLQALANAHDVLTQDNWARAPLREIVAGALAPFQGTRITLTGPHLAINANKALVLTMVLHELATNAVKYGAFSNETGRVSIQWTTREVSDQIRLQLCWEERGGPAVQEPQKKGFGSRLIKASLQEVQIVFAPAGITCTLEMSL